jgi:hypothetical protein
MRILRKKQQLQREASIKRNNIAVQFKSKGVFIFYIISYHPVLFSIRESHFSHFLTMNCFFECFVLFGELVVVVYLKD